MRESDPRMTVVWILGMALSTLIWGAIIVLWMQPWH